MWLKINGTHQLLVYADGVNLLGDKYCSMWNRCYATTASWEDIQWPFLGNGSVNTFPLRGSRLPIMKELDYNNGRAVFSTLSVPSGYKRDEIWSSVSYFCTGVCEEITSGGKAEESPMLEAVARKRLVKTPQAEEA
jgi:hypothetical protein